jgi:hypothetical protein
VCSESCRCADRSDVVQSRGGTSTLVVGATSHDAACRRLARAGPGRAYRVRMTTSESPTAPHAATNEQYQTGVYDAVPKPDAGIAVSDTVANLAHEAEPLEQGQLVVCVDGLAAPGDREERRAQVQFLHAITHRVEDVDGHCHVHLPVDTGAEVTHVVEPLFEYVVHADDVDDRSS